MVGLLISVVILRTPRGDDDDIHTPPMAAAEAKVAASVVKNLICMFDVVVDIYDDLTMMLI